MHKLREYLDELEFVELMIIINTSNDYTLRNEALTFTYIYLYIHYYIYVSI